MAALLAATAIFAQNKVSTPSLELQLCYGLGSGGVQNDGAYMRLTGGVGVGLGWNFNEHWGIISGADFALYYGDYNADVLYSRESVTPSGKTEPVVITNKLDGFSEQQFLDYIQVPVLVKYMAPLGETNHKFYVAAGTKIGFPIVKMTTTSAVVSYDIDEKDGYNFVSTNELVSRDSKLNTGINLSASIEGGVRFRFTKSLGLYAGLFCDYGLYNPCKASGTSVYINNPERAGTDPLVARKTDKDLTCSVLEASNVSKTLPIENSGRFLPGAHTFIFGAKARLYFGLLNK